MNFLSLIFPQIIYKTTSKFSGEIKVIDHVFERRLVVGGLTQSGGITKGMWRKALNYSMINDKGLRIKDVLVLGLGAGTVGKIINKKWPEAKIVGVEIDQVIIDAGKKYFQLGNVENLEIVIGDAVDYINSPSHLEFISESNKMLNQVQHDNKKFDLVIVDLYKGFFIEKKIQEYAFLQKITQKMTKNGFVIFNVIPSRNDNFEASKFLDKLNRIFKDNFCKRIITNDFFFCTNDPIKGTPFTKGGELSMAKKRKRKKSR